MNIPFYLILSSIIQIILLIVALSYKTTDDLKFFRWFVIFACVFDLMISGMAIAGVTNLFLFHFYTPIELGALSYVLLRWESAIANRRTVVWVALLLLISCFLLEYVLSGLDNFESISTVFSCVVLVAISLRGLIFNYGVMYKRLILSGVLIYAFFNAIPYAIINSTATLPYMVHSVVNIIMNVLFAIGIIWNHKYLYRRLR